ncbi:AraC family transcriptional regulator [Rhizobium anhuiense]|uniref:AraC family transcriptional regulator n=1 Tax=Rhizobium anhuiense TaxID=1184720 RepID=A0ABX4J4A0_9HYPH|nr:helix-turn-helix domain-containing protein [Rhizobium anhuiense]PDS41182.1 AraC family transcriptional regulator [Rhizobium anhuiense]PDS49642.1 AraC family transcriptional regulator [Rhizobium anhuiense]
MNRADAEARRVIHTRSGVGATADIIQREALRFSRLTFDHPTLVVVRHGEKIFASAKGEWRVKSGEAVAIAKGHRFDITNRPDAHGSYQANWLVFEPEMLRAFASAAQVSQPVRSLGRLEIDFIEAFARARDAIQNPTIVPDKIARHRMEEILLWLGQRGVSLAAIPPSTFSQRVRELLMATLDEMWTAAIVARQLHMSEATLRRHLAAENNNFSSLLADVRMSHALSLLQSTDLPVGNIAHDVGYESASRFATRFRKRFGFAPTAVRGHRRDNSHNPATGFVDGGSARTKTTSLI